MYISRIQASIDYVKGTKRLFCLDAIGVRWIEGLNRGRIEKGN
jgi:hypothetical protein